MNRDAFLKNGFTSEQMIEDYKTNNFTIKELSQKYNVSTKTIQRRLKEAGIETLKHRKTDFERKKETFHPNEFAQWLREHPNTILPRSVKQISLMTNIDQRIIKNYLYYRKRRQKEMAEKIDLFRYPKSYIVSTENKCIPLLGIKSYKPQFNFEAQTIVFKLELKMGLVKYFILPMGEINKILKEPS